MLILRLIAFVCVVFVCKLLLILHQGRSVSLFLNFFDFYHCERGRTLFDLGELSLLDRVLVSVLNGDLDSSIQVHTSNESLCLSFFFVILFVDPENSLFHGCGELGVFLDQSEEGSSCCLDLFLTINFDMIVCVTHLHKWHATTCLYLHRVCKNGEDEVTRHVSHNSLDQMLLWLAQHRSKFISEL